MPHDFDKCKVPFSLCIPCDDYLDALTDGKLPSEWTAETIMRVLARARPDKYGSRPPIE